MGEGDADAANHQHLEAPGHKRQHMARDEDHKQRNQQLAALHLACQQHKRQRHQRHHPGVDGQHNARLRGFHMEARGDIGEQAHRDKLGGIKDKCRDRKRNHPQPRGFARDCIHRHKKDSRWSEVNKKQAILKLSPVGIQPFCDVNLTFVPVM